MVNGLGLLSKHQTSHKTLFDGEKLPLGAALPFCQFLARLIRRAYEVPRRGVDDEGTLGTQEDGLERERATRVTVPPSR